VCVLWNESVRFMDSKGVLYGLRVCVLWTESVWFTDRVCVLSIESVVL
jgi:hypothetical protein